MLILDRKIGESIIIGDDIKLTIIESDRYLVRIGIHAPKDISIHREEIYLRIKNEKKEKL